MHLAQLLSLQGVMYVYYIQRNATQCLQLSVSHLTGFSGLTAPYVCDHRCPFLACTQSIGSI